MFEPVDDVVCRRGWFSLIESVRGRGWVATTDIRTTAADRDGRSLINSCDALTWTRPAPPTRLVLALLRTRVESARLPAIDIGFRAVVGSAWLVGQGGGLDLVGERGQRGGQPPPVSLV